MERRGVHGKLDVLVIEDNHADILLIEEVVREYDLPIVLRVVEDGEKAIAFIDSADNDESVRCPQLILLDLNLPRRTGLEILKRLRTSSRFEQIPVIVVTSSDSRQDREQAAQFGAVRYFRKPANYDEFLKLGDVLRQMLEQTQMPSTNDRDPA
jgi:CheY-like chemotaxis protein